MDLREALEGKLTKKELELLKTSFDVIGDVAVVEIPEELTEKEKLIAQTLKELNRNIRTVVRKEGEREGVFRLRKMRMLVGDGTETVHTEHGCRFRLDVATCYFSPREGTERQRIAGNVEKGETVLVMFAGVGPYAIQIAKTQPEAVVHAIEINPTAFRYMEDNIELNKVKGRVIPHLGDVRDKCPEFFGKCDRVVMPLPKGAYQYLPLALKCLKPNRYLHFYHWEHENDLFQGAMDLLNEAAVETKRKVTFTDGRKVLPYGPRIWKICLDAEIL